MINYLDIKINEAELINTAKKNKNFVGIINNSGSYNDLKKSRRVIIPSSLYGYRLKRNTTSLWKLRKNHGMDLIVTDNQGIIKNHIEYDDAINRIQKAKKENIKINFFFGGSTLMGMGSRMPQYTIPSIVEKILMEKYNKNSVCINFGIGGTYCQEAYNLLINDAIRLGKPDKVIFYDGWNCSSYLTKINLLKKTNFIDIPNGTSLRQIEHDQNLLNSYNVLSNLKKISKLTLSLFFSLVSGILSSKYSEKLEFVISKYLNLKNNNLNRFTSNYKQSDQEIITKSINEYKFIHESVTNFCNSNQIKFFHFFQPLVFFGKKNLTKDEIEWKKNGYSSGDPEIFHKFYKSFLEKKLNIIDLTNTFDDENKQTYIDSGHLNILGNFLVSKKIAKIISD